MEILNKTIYEFIDEMSKSYNNHIDINPLIELLNQNDFPITMVELKPIPVFGFTTDDGIYISIQKHS